MSNFEYFGIGILVSVLMLILNLVFFILLPVFTAKFVKNGYWAKIKKVVSAR
jgi:hypothetical protein